MKKQNTTRKLSVSITFITEEAKEKFIAEAKATGRSVAGFLKYAATKELTKLLVLFAFSASAQDTISLHKSTYTQIYKGLRAEEYYRQANTDCIEIANSLNTIIQQQNDSLQLSLNRLDEVNYELDYLNYQYQEAIKARPTPWYKSPWTWGTAGLIIGTLLYGL